jgi:hypothetical protein
VKIFIILLVIASLFAPILSIHATVSVTTNSGCTEVYAKGSTAALPIHFTVLTSDNQHWLYSQDIPNTSTQMNLDIGDWTSQQVVHVIIYNYDPPTVPDYEVLAQYVLFDGYVSCYNTIQ